MSELIKIRDKLKEEGKVIPATFDAMFKEVMKGCPNYLADILYQVTGLNKEMILKHMEIQDTEHGISHILEKRKRSDVIIKVKNNVLNLEMNIEFYKGLYEKNEAYLRRVGSEMIKIGQDYKSGFTLIELLAIIAILGMIALTTYPAVSSVIEYGEEKAYKERAALAYAQTVRQLHGRNRLRVHQSGQLHKG